MTTLVAWTGTAAARTALDWAIIREYLLDRHVILCHVAGPSDERPLSKAALDDLAATLQQDRSGIRFTAELLHGDPVEQLERRGRDGSLLVVGTDTRNEHPGRFEHSLGMALSQRGVVPVVIVPIDARHGAPGFVIGFDGSPASQAALEFAAAEADRRSESLVVARSWRLHPVEEDAADAPAGRFDEELDGRRLEAAGVIAPLRERYPGLAVTLRFAHGETVQGLLATAGGAGLLVLGTDDLSRTSAGESTDHAVVMRMHTAVAIIPAGCTVRVAAPDAVVGAIRP
ncbi:hypothetical protein GRS96_10135 [Rathayibacter sp. VKM Ac-2803]|uniref:universal stress protein n=1 Tax=unclassified Rathayibacter TaxID=2609250 RepID=UPI001356ADD7|nr:MULTISPECIES: universal stress protein [unclassified Rathayibacter]MWV49631.1 hypothetical protein [Rathayibacter sp. VKM Ac-2803]MWV59764.1 hypothetical protein [Rathayibacter sp. VKM Ac-2754]